VVIGVLNLESPQPQTFTAGSLTLLERSGLLAEIQQAVESLAL
jgi:hypothetical protein